jgi:hypothetical protein
MFMKKLLMITFVLMTPMYLSAELMKDSKTFRYYTSPATQGINQDEYHALVWQCKDIVKHCAAQQAALNAQFAGQRGSYQQTYGQLYVKNMITEHLQRLATPTSIRLLADLEKKNFIF